MAATTSASASSRQRTRRSEPQDIPISRPPPRTRSVSIPALRVRNLLDKVYGVCWSGGGVPRKGLIDHSVLLDG